LAQSVLLETKGSRVRVGKKVRQVLKGEWAYPARLGLRERRERGVSQVLRGLVGRMVRWVREGYLDLLDQLARPVKMETRAKLVLLERKGIREGREIRYVECSFYK
jgi:hypothetical protein